MNKLTKVGCSALCGSLATISAANAGDFAVTGGADVTYMSHGGAVTGNPIGMASAVTFTGAGELDNGWTFDFVVAEGDTVAYSAARVAITMGGLGTLEFDQGNSGNGIAAYDNVMPTAWEEPHGAGLSGGVITVMGSGNSSNVQYSTPKFLDGIVGAEAAFTYAHEVGTTDNADKSVSGASNTATSRGYDLTLKANPALGTEILSGLNLYAGASLIEQYDNATVGIEDKHEGVGAVTYALGPVDVGYMVSVTYNGSPTGVSTYKNHGFGIAFNVNDDLSVSYGQYDSRKAGYNTGSDVGGPADRTVEVTSWQAAYTMGGASFRVADVNADNILFSGGANQSATIVSMSLAF